MLVRVDGGGLTGQADAVRMGLARAIVEHDEETRPALREKGLLTRDPRKVERKKPGGPRPASASSSRSVDRLERVTLHILIGA